MSYTEMKARHAKEINALPMKFAFNNEQLAKALEELGVTADAVVSIGGGGIIREADSDLVAHAFIRHTNEMEAAMKDHAFAVSAFRYELNNHEYEFTGCAIDAIEALGYTCDEVMADKFLSAALYEAGGRLA